MRRPVVVLVKARPASGLAVLAFVALADLAVLPMSFVARAFPLEDLGAGFYWAFVVATGLLVATIATLVGRGPRRQPRPRRGAGVGAGGAAGGRHPGLAPQPGAAFGYSPTGNSRLYGISNYAFGQVAASSCLLAAFVASRWPSRRDASPPSGCWLPRAGRDRHADVGLGRGRHHRLHPTILVFAAPWSPATACGC